MYQEINSNMKEYEKDLNITMVKFRHAIGAFKDVIHFLKYDIKYNMYISMDSNRMLLVDVYNKEYNLILDMIKKERPRLIVYIIEIKDDKCIFNISFDTNWEKDSEYISPSIIGNL